MLKIKTSIKFMYLKPLIKILKISPKYAESLYFKHNNHILKDEFESNRKIHFMEQVFETI